MCVAFKPTDASRVELCEIGQAVRETVASRYGLKAVFADLDAALADPPDAAVICTPAHLHVSMAIQLADAGVHLLIEKPLGIGLEDLDRLTALVEQRELTSLRRVCVPRPSGADGDA